MWKRRLDGKIKELRKDLSQSEILRKDGIMKARFNETLERKYNIKVEGLAVFIEYLKQRVVAVSSKVARYQCRIDQFRHTRVYSNE